MTLAEPLHELTHMMFAIPFARVIYERDGIVAYTRIEWQPETPVVWVRVSHLAPTFVGSGIAVACVPILSELIAAVEVAGTTVAVALGVPAAAPAVRVFFVLFVFVNWLLYWWPSVPDRRPFENV